MQSADKEKEIYEQVTALLKSGIIKHSSATRYSQILLQPKKPEGWRMCIDYRYLNDCSTGGSWPIPNIKGIFERLGQHRSSIYGVIDLVQGYHQTPVALQDRKSVV